MISRASTASAAWPTQRSEPIAIVGQRSGGTQGVRVDQELPALVLDPSPLLELGHDCGYVRPISTDHAGELLMLPPLLPGHHSTEWACPVVEPYTPGRSTQPFLWQGGSYVFRVLLSLYEADPGGVHFFTPKPGPSFLFS